MQIESDIESRINVSFFAILILFLNIVIKFYFKRCLHTLFLFSDSNTLGLKPLLIRGTSEFIIRIAKGRLPDRARKDE